MKREWLSVLLVALVLAGCLGDGDTADPSAEGDPETGAEEPSNERTDVSSGCNEQDESGLVTPTETLVVEAEAGGPDATAGIDIERNAGVGEMYVVLEDEDGQVWWDHTSGSAGINNQATQGINLDPGNYTLTASLETGARHVGSLRLAITWGDSPC